ncbi:hypothetical protein EBB07_29115 [Paenibacillaceae bacterium]|nr:hypothetical protein EBB07_29115 [Paenibacillaceae bacterium]
MLIRRGVIRMTNTIKEKLKTDMKQAMKDKEKDKLVVIRFVIDRVQKREKELFREIDESEVISLIQTLRKQNEESIAAYEIRGDLDFVTKLSDENKILKDYLPILLNEDEVFEIVSKMIFDDKNKGPIMKQIIPLLKGRADNKTIANAVNRMLV